MIFPTIRKLMPLAVLGCWINLSLGQDPGLKTTSATTEKKESKPFRILTNGKRITVQSTKEISNIMLWTASGHRIVEQKDINSTSFSFSISVNEKIFFLMVELENGKRYTEKIGVQ